MGRRRVAGTQQVERAGLYVRVSMDRAKAGMQDEIISPETQEDRARQYAASQGWTVAAVERDIDESAYRQHYSHREGLVRLLEAVERGEITRIVVWKFSRLSRRLREFTEICDRVEAAGAGVASVSEQVDTSTSAGRLIRNILASFAQFQSEELSEQISETWLTKARRGERPGGNAPYGTILKKGMLEPDPDSHHHLVAMYTTYRDTGSVSAVYDYLVDNQVPAPHGERWSLQTIRIILTNPAYVGRLIWNDEEYEAKWAPLVPPDLWQEVAELLQARRGAPGPRRDARLLTGLIRCGNCGRGMWTHYGNRGSSEHRGQTRLYRCTDRGANRKGCDQVPVVIGEEIEAAAWQAVLSVAGMANLHQLVAMARSGFDPDESTRARRQALSAEKAKIEEAAARAHDMLDAGDISREQFRQRNRQYLDRLQELQAQLAALTPGAAPPPPEAVMEAARSAAAATTDQERRRIMEAMDAAIDVTADRVVLRVLGLAINLRARRIGDTWHLGAKYHRLDYRGKYFTDKQVRFLQRTYRWASKKKLAARMGRSYSAIKQAVARLRAQGVSV